MSDSLVSRTHQVAESVVLRLARRFHRVYPGLTAFDADDYAQHVWTEFSQWLSTDGDHADAVADLLGNPTDMKRWMTTFAERKMADVISRHSLPKRNAPGALFINALENPDSLSSLADRREPSVGCAPGVVSALRESLCSLRAREVFDLMTDPDPVFLAAFQAYARVTQTGSASLRTVDLLYRPARSVLTLRGDHGQKSIRWEGLLKKGFLDTDCGRALCSRQGSDYLITLTDMRIRLDSKTLKGVFTLSEVDGHVPLYPKKFLAEFLGCPVLHVITAYGEIREAIRTLFRPA